MARVVLSGYTAVARRDRDDGRAGGGAIIFARDAFADYVTLLKVSGSCERVWVLVHSLQGPILVCIWYRPPAAGDLMWTSNYAPITDSIITERAGKCHRAGAAHV